MFITFLAVFVRIFSNSLANVFQKQLTVRGVSPVLINFIMYAGLSFLCIPLALSFDWAGFGNSFWISSILGGLFGALGNFYLVKALEKGELSILGPINAYKSVVAMLFGMFLLREFPSAIGIAAVGLIIWGSYVIFETQDEGFSIKLLKRWDIRYRIFALIFTAIEAVFIKDVINQSDVTTSFVMWCFWGMVFSGGILVRSFLLLLEIKDFGPPSRGGHAFLSVILLMGLMQLSTNFVFARMNVSYGLALFQLSAILSVILGWKCFNEQNIKKKLFGSIVMTIGAVLLIIFK